MTWTRPKLILWTGKKHSGKTTRALKLAETARSEGFTVAGLLALSLYSKGRLIGFDAFDLQSQNQAPLARRNTQGSTTPPFTFIADGLKLGRVALSAAVTKSAGTPLRGNPNLIIVDEFGPLELNHRGWRKNIDLLLAGSDAGASLILLIVRQELTDKVAQLYKDIPYQEIVATEPDSICQVIAMLKDRQNKLIVK